MKKLFIITMLVTIIGVTYGQRANEAVTLQTANSTYYLSKDTATDAGDVWLGIAYTSAGYTALVKDYYLAVQPVVATLTGSPTGTVYLQASLNQSNWVTLNTNNSTLSATIDTMAYASASTLWVVETFYPYYRVFYNGAGTQTSTITAKWWLVKKED
jgi:hypothetical protein